MWSTDLVAHLSPKASQLLLCLVVSQTTETAFTKQEFAALTGLSSKSISRSLSELEKYGLVSIITCQGKPPLVRLEGWTHEVRINTPVEEDNVGNAGAAGADVLELPTQEAAEIPVEEAEVDAAAIAAGLLAGCQLADAAEDRRGQIDALTECWDYAFPETEYEFARLQPATAKAWLKWRSAEGVGRVILNAVKRGGDPIKYPRSYIEAALVGIDQKKQQDGPEQVINDDIRAWTKLGRRQHGNK